MADVLSELSQSLQARVRAASSYVASVSWGSRSHVSAILWRDNQLVTSEQSLPRADAYEAVLPGGARVDAVLVGRDPATNVALLRLTSLAPAQRVADASGVGALVLAVGSDGEGNATARLGPVEVLGPAWESMRGGRIDRLIRIGVRLPSAAEGGPVVDSEGALLGMSTFGPRRDVMVIPTATVARAVEQLQSHGGGRRGWLGVGLQEVALPRDIAARAGAEGGLMVMSLADDAPAAGRLLPGDILVEIAGTKVAHPRTVAGLLSPEKVGQSLPISLVRGGEVTMVNVTVAARPQ